MSLPTPPSGILDRDQPWYRGKISDAQWDRVKAKLTGGTDAGGTSYSKLIDCSLGEAEKIISNMKKDPRGYPQMYMPGGGEAYQVMIDYYQFLKDAYLFDEPKPEPEEIPVEVEVVEVEQKTVDEPIVIKIEAPFESTPEVKLSAPKRISVPRRSGLITPTIKKKSTAERMADAFTNNLLDPLVDSIQNPPAPAQPKQRKQKETLVKIKKAVKPSKFDSKYTESKGGKPFENLTAFAGLKIKNAFGRAAEARRMATETGMPEQKKGFYATRALGFEFGGDRIARTRGTFAKSPDATLDPSLTKQQRYVQGMFGTRTVRGASNFDKNIVEVTKRFEGLQKTFEDVINTKKKSPSSSETVEEFNKTVEEIRDALQKGNKLQKGINEAKKDQAKLARDAADDAQMDAEEAAMEKGTDNATLTDVEKGEKQKKKKKRRFNPLDLLKRFKGLRKLFKRLKNPIKTAKALQRLASQKINKALKPVKALAETVATNGRKVVDGAVELGKRFKGGAVDAAGKATNAVKGGLGAVGGFFSRVGDAVKGGARRTWDAATSIGGWIGKKAQAAGDLIASAPGKVGAQLKKFGVPQTWDDLVKLVKSPMGQQAVDLALGPIGKYVRDQLTNPKSALKIAQRGINNAKVRTAIIKKGGQELLEKILTKLGIKVGGQAIPGIGQVVNIGYGVIEAIVRGVMGDLKGSALSLGGAIPWVGAGFSIVDIIRDIDTEAYTQHIEPNLASIAMGNGDPLIGFFSAVAGSNIGTELESDPPSEPAASTDEPKTNMNRGGVLAMTGEAGDELIIDPDDGGYNPLQSLAPIIVAMRELTKRSGPWAGPIYNFVKQTTDPIAKELNLPVTPVKSTLGGVGGEKKGLKMKGGGGGFAGMLEQLGALFSGGGGAPDQAGGGPMGATLSGNAAQLIGNDTEFLAEVKRVAQKFGAKEGDLLGLMASESGFDPAADNGTHVGLIQFSRDSAATVGTTQAALKGMTRAQQMKYVEKYFQHWKDAGYFPDNPTAGQLYTVVFAPAYSGKAENEALYSRGSAAYSGNAALDLDKDGKITMAEMSQRIESKKQAFGITDSNSGPVLAPPPAAPDPPVISPPAQPVRPAAPAETSKGTPKIDILSLPALKAPTAAKPPIDAPLSGAEMNQMLQGGASFNDILKARLGQ